MLLFLLLSVLLEQIGYSVSVFMSHKGMRVCIYSVQEDHPIMSFTVSKNGRLALLNVATQVSLS